jgi:transposase-like protein
MKTLNPALAKVMKRLHYPLDVILTCVRWYVAYPLSLRHLEEMMAERGTSVDHSTVIAGRSNCCRYWRKRFAVASGQLERAGEWTRRTSASRASGNTDGCTK